MVLWYLLLQDLKHAVKKDVLPDGSIIAKGARILYSPYAVNRMTSFWGEDAEQFRSDIAAPKHVMGRISAGAKLV